MEKLKMFVVQEPVVAASCLIDGVACVSNETLDNPFVGKNIFHLTGSGVVKISGLFLPAVVRPILDSMETSKEVPQPALSDVVANMTGKKQG
ncbi:hypothetical protein L1049_012804 [Liquidambar formosana]|uniref:Uncharacterized protein n=1 Tax=Liquidambar formosana TaxID=63359 RepID=A0AAP0WX00_LIQFO